MVKLLDMIYLCNYYWNIKIVHDHSYPEAASITQKAPPSPILSVFNLCEFRCSKSYFFEIQELTYTVLPS